MKTKSLHQIPVNGKITKVIQDDKSTIESVSFVIDDGRTIKLTSDHDQDCCESVYADFSIFKYVSPEVIGSSPDFISITGVEWMGFLMHFTDKKFFIPCYNYQNGYYSRDLSLVITVDNVESKLDISDLVEDNIV